MADNSIPTIIPPPQQSEHMSGVPMGIAPAPVAVGIAAKVQEVATTGVPESHDLSKVQNDAVEPALALHQIAAAADIMHANTSPEDSLSNVNAVPEGGAPGPSHDDIGGDDSEPLEYSEENDQTAKRKRLCRYQGCNRVIKSQGLCQRHGGKAKRCKVPGCDKQAQGTHDGMCKRHWKIKNKAGAAAAADPKEEDVPPPPEGTSVYDGILPESIAYRPSVLDQNQLDESNSTLDTDNPITPPAELNIMPLVLFLREGASQEFGWHRNSERRARGMFPCTLLTLTFEPWEHQLCLIETMLLSGGTPYANFRDLAHAWGRDVGFHHSLTSSVCGRRGEVDRKKRSDLGKRKAREEAESREKMEQLIAIENAASTLQCLPVSNPPQVMMPMSQQQQPTMYPGLSGLPPPVQQQQQQQQQQQHQHVMQAPAPQVHQVQHHNMQPPRIQQLEQQIMPPPVHPGMQHSMQQMHQSMQQQVHQSMQQHLQPQLQPQMQAGIQQVVHGAMQPPMQAQMQPSLQPQLLPPMQPQMQTIYQVPVQPEMQQNFQTTQQSPPPPEGLQSDGNGHLIGL